MNPSQRDCGRDISMLFEDDQAIEDALAAGVGEALREHKRAGVPIVEWRNGNVVIVPPEEIPIDGAPDNSWTSP